MRMRTPAPGDPLALDDDLLIAGDNLAVMRTLPEACFDMAWLVPGPVRRLGHGGVGLPQA